MGHVEDEDFVLVLTKYKETVALGIGNQINELAGDTYHGTALIGSREFTSTRIRLILFTARDDSILIVTAVVPFALWKAPGSALILTVARRHALRRGDTHRRVIRGEFEIGGSAFAGNRHFLRRDIAVTEFPRNVMS